MILNSPKGVYCPLWTPVAICCYVVCWSLRDFLFFVILSSVFSFISCKSSVVVVKVGWSKSAVGALSLIAPDSMSSLFVCGKCSVIILGRCCPIWSSDVSHWYIAPLEFWSRSDSLELSRNCLPLGIHLSWLHSRFFESVAIRILKNFLSSFDSMKLNLDCVFNSSILLRIPANVRPHLSSALEWISSFRLSYICHETSHSCWMSFDTQHLLDLCPPFWRL